MAAVTVALLGAAAVAAGVKAYSDYKSNQAQAEAAQAALDQQQAAAQGAQGRSEALGREGARIIGEGSRTAQETIRESTGRAEGALGEGMAGFAEELGKGKAEAFDLYRQGEQSALATLEGRSNRLGELLDKGFSDFQADPGYQFRLEQGQQALSNMQAAQGGRFSGRAMQEGQQFAQGLASQEFGNFANRRLAQLGFAGQYDAQDLQARGMQAGYQYGTGSALAGLAYGSGAALAGQRYNTGSALAGLYSAEGQNLANLQYGAAGNQANILQGLGAQGISLTQSMLPWYQAPVGYAGGGYSALGGFAGSMGQLAAAGAGYYAAPSGGAPSTTPNPPPESYSL